MNKYEIIINQEGYIRMDSSESGYISCSETTLVESTDELEAKNIALGKYKGICSETLNKSDFNVDFNKEEIVRDDTFTSYSSQLIYITDKNFYDYVYNSINGNFPLNLNEKDFKPFLQSLKNENESTTDTYLKLSLNSYEYLVSQYWIYIEKKYFYKLGIKFSIPKLNLNKIKTATLFDKKAEDVFLSTDISCLGIDMLFGFKYFKPSTNIETNIISFLNDILSTNRLDSFYIDTVEKFYIKEKKLSKIPSKTLLRKQEKNKQRKLKMLKNKLIKDVKKETIEKLKQELFSSNIDFGSIKINIEVIN
jgi:hypothetical protein